MFVLFPQMYGTQEQRSSKSGDPIVKFWPRGTSDIAKAKREMRRGCLEQKRARKEYKRSGAGEETRREERRGLNESRETFTFDD